MRKIKTSLISKTVSDLCIKANVTLRKDVLSALRKSLGVEKNKKAKNILRALIENAKIAQKEKLAICQDTGMAVIFVDIGQSVNIVGGSLRAAIDNGVADGYRRGYLRKSVVSDPFIRKNTNTNLPAIIHYEVVPGDKIKIAVLPKGFGSENVSKIKMLKPTDGIKEIEEFVLGAVKEAGPDACPPFIVGVGIGGTIERAALLAKKALLRKVTTSPGQREAKRSLPEGDQVTSYTRKLKRDLLKKINRLNIGPMGLGGKATCLGVSIETYPTHIAGLGVAVNISCHALRSASRII